METGKLNLNYDGVSEINKEKKQQPPVEPQMMEMQNLGNVEEQIPLRKSEEEQRKVDAQIMQGGMVVKEVGADETYQYVDFQDQKVQEEIEKAAKVNLSAGVLDQKVSYAQSMQAYLNHTEGGKVKVLQELQERSAVFGKISLKKRKKELDQAKKLFDKMDALKEKVKKELVPEKQLNLNTQIIALKAKALSCRARAYAKDEAVLNDQLANIAIASNYELQELYELFSLKINSNDHDGAAEMLRREVNAAKNNIPFVIDQIALDRRRKSGLEIFNAAVAKRKKEMKEPRIDGRVPADIIRSKKMADSCRQSFAGYKLNEGDSMLDTETEKTFDKNMSEPVEGALALRKMLQDFVREIERNAKRIEDGKPVLKDARDFLNSQYVSMVNLCSEYLNKNKKDDASALEEKSYEYVKQLKAKLVQNQRAGVSFNSQFKKIADLFIENRRRTWTSEEDKRTDALIVGFESDNEKRKAEQKSLLKIKSAAILKDDPMKSVLGENDVVTMEDLKKKSSEIKLEEKSEKEKLFDLKYNLPEGETWKCDSNLLAIDAVLRSNGIFIEGGARTLLKAVPEDVKNLTDVLAHFDKVLYRHDALAACWPALKPLLADRFELVHEERVVPVVKDEARFEYDRFNDALAEEIQAATLGGSAVMLYDSVTKHYVTITSVFQQRNSETFYITYLDDKQGANKEDTAKRKGPVAFNEFMAEKTKAGHKFSIEYLRKLTEEEKAKRKKAEEKKEEHKNEEIVDAESEKVKGYYESLKEIYENNTETSKMVSSAGKTILKLMKTVKYTQEELEAGTVYDKLYEEMRQLKGWFKVFDNECEARIKKYLENNEEKITPIPSLIDKLEEIRQNMLSLIQSNVTEDPNVKKIMLRLENKLKKIDFSSVESFTAKCNGLFGQDNCDSVTKTVIDTWGSSMSNSFLIEKESNVSYREMLSKPQEYSFIVGAHENKEELSLADLEKYRNVDWTETNQRREELVSNTYTKNNCWACSVDVLLQSRGFKLPDGYKSVMQYLPKNIRTMREAAQYYAFIANKMYSPIEHEEFIKKVVGDKFSLESQTYYPDDYRKKNKSQAVFEEDIMKEIKKAIEDGSAISVRDPKRKHYITITGLSDDGQTFTLVDSEAMQGQPQQIAVKDYFKNMFENDVNNNPRGDAVILSWLKKTSKKQG
ncbi:MAG: hypothetical protein MJ110_06865 [Lachnospiraceae bacterium]|nr:hypothetical protein [Lachnospiraceae bacterium]